MKIHSVRSIVLKVFGLAIAGTIAARATVPDQIPAGTIARSPLVKVLEPPDYWGAHFGVPPAATHSATSGSASPATTLRIRPSTSRSGQQYLHGSGNVVASWNDRLAPAGEIQMKPAHRAGAGSLPYFSSMDESGRTTMDRAPDLGRPLVAARSGAWMGTLAASARR
jgi:hypothetical protein